MIGIAAAGNGPHGLRHRPPLTGSRESDARSPTLVLQSLGNHRIDMAALVRAVLSAGQRQGHTFHGRLLRSRSHVPARVRQGGTGRQRATRPATVERMIATIATAIRRPAGRRLRVMRQGPNLAVYSGSVWSPRSQFAGTTTFWVFVRPATCDG